MGLGIVASDSFVQSMALWSRGVLNGPTFVKLFKNDITVSPATTNADFIEANFLGYTSKLIGGTFGNPIRIQPGEWETDSGKVIWTPTANDAQLIYGAYLTAPVDWWWAYRFPLPHRVLNGVPIAIKARIQSWALSIACS